MPRLSKSLVAVAGTIVVCAMKTAVFTNRIATIANNISKAVKFYKKKKYTTSQKKRRE